MYLEYEVKARQIERQFKRRLTKRGYFLTAKGNINSLVDYGKTEVAIKTEKGKEPIRLKRSALRKAINFFYFKRTAIREDFEAFSKYTSAIFGIIVQCFEQVSKLQKLQNGLFRISLLGTRFYCSGLERDPSILKLVKELNGRFVLFNYKSILESPQCLQWLDTYDLYAVIDSGSFSLFNADKKKSKEVVQQQLFGEEGMDELILEGYARFINEHKSNQRILGYFPLDRIGDPIATRRNYKRLKELTNANIFPVWQITDSLEELDRLVAEEPEMIGLGGAVPFLSSRKHIVRDILEKVTKRHPNVPFHGLGISDELLLEFNLFSADSTAFLNARKWMDGRKVYLPNGVRVNAPDDMSTLDIIKQNLRHLIGLERIESIQLNLEDFCQGA
jgi:hypothetical protein